MSTCKYYIKTTIYGKKTISCNKIQHIAYIGLTVICSLKKVGFELLLKKHEWWTLFNAKGYQVDKLGAATWEAITLYVLSPILGTSRKSLFEEWRNLLGKCHLRRSLRYTGPA